MESAWSWYWGMLIEEGGSASVGLFPISFAGICDDMVAEICGALPGNYLPNTTCCHLCTYVGDPGGNLFRVVILYGPKSPAKSLTLQPNLAY